MAGVDVKNTSTKITAIQTSPNKKTITFVPVKMNSQTAEQQLIQEWADRHNISGSISAIQCAFEDAATLMNKDKTAPERLPYIPYKRGLDQRDTLIVKKRGGGERRIKSGKWWINRNTPVGEDAEVWERMPHDGRRRIHYSKIIATEKSPIVNIISRITK